MCSNLACGGMRTLIDCPALWWVQTESLRVRTSGERRKWRYEIKSLRKELKQREEVLHVDMYSCTHMCMYIPDILC